MVQLQGIGSREEATHSFVEISTRGIKRKMETRGPSLMLKLCPACLYDPLLQIRSYIRYKMKEEEEEEASPCDDGIRLLVSWSAS